MGLEEKIEFVAHDAGLHMHAAGRRIEGEDAIQMAAEIDHDAITDHLTSERSAGSTGNQAEMMLIGEAYEFSHIILGCGQGDRDGQFLIFRGIGCIECAHAGVEVQFAGEVLGEVAKSVMERSRCSVDGHGKSG